MGPNEELNSGIQNPDRPESPAPSRGRRRGGRGRRGGVRRASRSESRPELGPPPPPTLDELADAQEARQDDAAQLEAQEAELSQAEAIETSEGGQPGSAGAATPEFAEPEPARAAAFPQAQRRAPVTRRPEHRERRPASATSVQHAIDEANRIIDALRAALEDMEEVLETLELAERQKDTDEQEIESLRRALRQMHRSREGGRGRS